MRRWAAPLLVLGFLGSVNSSRAGILDPTPFWDVIAASDAIVVARVEHIERATRSWDDRGGVEGVDLRDLEDEVQVIVRETWKGPPSSDLRFPQQPHFTNYFGLRPGDVVVAFLRRGENVLRDSEEREQILRENSGDPFYVCPPIDKTVVIAEHADGTLAQRGDGSFIEVIAPSEDRSLDFGGYEIDPDAQDRWIVYFVGRWFPVDMLGVMPLREDEVAVFRTFVAETLELQASGSVRADLLGDWRVRAASRRATRWHALSGFPKPVSSVEMQRVAEGFIREPSGGHAFWETLRLLQGFDSPEFDLSAVSVVEAELAENPLPRGTIDNATLVLERFGVSGARDLLEAAAGYSCSPMPPGSLQNTWELELMRLGIPRVAPASIPNQFGR